ncbi:conserved Plasmodium protein, unknown function [Plasmodium berghei]|uniref:Ubiquitin-like domain-containing protein n=2 Tax=Plasmodium berghei TaxID=5821 RepID=A0A509ALR7_PLABA|nr:conserved Plasmodium protein, unknown function [Plasmodium berghei ANKA]CXI43180.1 conserved Plasmodium protein, unknown function [Plasmodium berghei]SCM22260.1 conserved Plasmodium protein, unknown function [Plasmodium berghei]SCN25364.1 conserved Plasmodium protein, unknown function [Plasmodium berghei]SCO60331.1 conserved Plasmodium protein, unknown function [Plasmodium berghei]SCO62048.1 conserved Plasmodium protein, unknown function [Plasmodium berghei]|eukprot:XP_034421581.1 conserved Plasmodium protein, unknown function [Plasmodium berghei ANKA]
MKIKKIKFIVLRPKDVPQYLEIDINCNDQIKNIKNKYFEEYIKNDLNVRFIYMGKILDDVKKLEDYINFYYKDLFSNNSNLINKDNKNISSKFKERCIPIIIHVKITEKPLMPKNDIFGNKPINGILSKLALLTFVSLLWVYRFNYVDGFPIFCLIVLIIFTIFITATLLYGYIILFFQILFKIFITVFYKIKEYTIRLYTYISEKAKGFLLIRSITNNNPN